MKNDIFVLFIDKKQSSCYHIVNICVVVLKIVVKNCSLLERKAWVFISMSIRRCLGCMKEIEDNTLRCPYCGFSKDDPVAPHLLQPKSVLNNRYVVGRSLRVDGEGITYIAYDVNMSTPVIIREYMPQGLAQRETDRAVVVPGCEAKYKALKSDFIDLFTSLADLKILNNIRKVYGLFEQNNTVYAVCEYLEYITLNQYLKDHAGELDWEQAEILFKPLLESLIVIHNTGVIHRGLSPETVVVMSDGSLKIIGFSICSARVMNSEIPPSLNEGYSAPEQYSRMTPHGEWTDVYGICAVLYKVLTGTMPPNASTRAINDNLIDLSELNSMVPRYVSRTVMAGLQYDYLQRTRTIKDLINVLYFTGKLDTTVMMNSSKAIPILDEDEEDYEEDDYFEQEKHQKKSSGSHGKKKEKKKRRVPIWIIVLLICIPIIALIALFLYDVMIGFSSDDRTDQSSLLSSGFVSSSLISSEQTSSAISSETVSSEPTTAMPEFRGTVYNETKIKEYENQFTFKAPLFDYSDLPAGQICNQNIAPGTEITKDEEIVLTISKGPKMITLPDAAGYSPTDYAAMLLLNYDIVADYTNFKEYSDTVPAGQIVRIEPAGGTQFDRSANITVKIYISIGSDPQQTISQAPETEEVSPEVVQEVIPVPIT